MRNLTIPPGFLYDVWLRARIPSKWEEISAYGLPHHQVYLPTGIPALAFGFTLEDMRPKFIDGTTPEDG